MSLARMMKTCLELSGLSSVSHSSGYSPGSQQDGGEPSMHFASTWPTLSHSLCIEVPIYFHLHQKTNASPKKLMCLIYLREVTWLSINRVTCTCLLGLGCLFRDRPTMVLGRRCAKLHFKYTCSTARKP